MPRQARKVSKTGIYHIMLRGINRQRVFQDDEDCCVFINSIRKVKTKSKFELYAYCIMGNHVHLLLREKDEPVSLIMQRVCSSFVYWYNIKHDRFGHLFQERFKSEAVENDKYLLTVLRYIHQNPVKAKIVEQIKDYRWSSYHEYINKNSLVDVEFIHEFFSKEKKRFIDGFIEFMNQDNEDTCLDYVERHRFSDDSILRLIEKNMGLRKVIST